MAAPGGGYQSLASTDMSAALTAGVAALIRARYPRLTAAAVTQAVERGATAPSGAGHGTRRGWGHGELNAAAALTAAAGLAAAPPLAHAVHVAIAAAPPRSRAPHSSRGDQAGRSRSPAPLARHLACGRGRAC